MEKSFLDQLNTPEPPNEARRVLGTAIVTFGVVGLISGCGLTVLSIMFMLPIAFLFNLITTPTGTFNWPILYPTASAIGLAIFGWILTSIGARLRS